MYTDLETALSNLLAGTTAIGETLPTVTRPLNFRVTVRDAHSGLQGVVGGINSSPVLGLSASSAAGPFVVTAPNTAVTWAAGSSQTVTWNVANTTAAPVSAASVNIRLSTDGGLTYPTVLATSTPNDSSETVTVPSLATTQARIMVEAADNYFFDISNVNFTISGAVAGPALSSLSPTSGTVGTGVVLTGTNLTGATAVSFNGTAATFTVNSGTQITATVPAGATTGTVTVTTPGGTSNGIPFAVTVPAPALPLARFPNVFDYQESRLTPAFPAFAVGFHSPSSTSDALVPTAGYTVNIVPAATVDFSGLLSTGPLNTGPLTRGATANAGWQLLGNPYPAPLDWAVVEATPGALPPGLGAAIYVFEPTSQYGGFYRSYVGGVGTGGFVGVLPTMQGFFIRATQAVPGGFTFQDLFRVTTCQNPPFRRQTAGPDPRSRLRLTLRAAAGATSSLDETLLYFDPAATATGTDAAFDAPKLPNSNQLSIASRVPGASANEALAISGLPPALLASGGRIPLELELPAAGPFQLSAAELVNFDPALPLVLLDLATGTRTNLRLAPTYAFMAAQAGALAGRFELLLGRAATAVTGRAPASAFSVWPNPVASGSGRLHVALAAAAPAATAVLRTILGQPVRNQALRNGAAELLTDGLATGTYLLTVQALGEPAVTQRVLVG